MLKMRSSSSDGGGTLSCGGWSPAISAFHFPISACIYFGRLGPFFKISKTIFSAVHASNANIPYAKLITKTCSTTWDSSRTCKPKTVQMASHSLHNCYERRDKWTWTRISFTIIWQPSNSLSDTAALPQQMRGPRCWMNRAWFSSWGNGRPICSGNHEKKCDLN